jgi:hypothetical protein
MINSFKYNNCSSLSAEVDYLRDENEADVVDDLDEDEDILNQAFIDDDDASLIAAPSPKRPRFNHFFDMEAGVAASDEDD